VRPVALALLLVPRTASAADAPPAAATTEAPATAHEAAPIHGFTYSAKRAATLGAATYGHTASGAYQLGGRVFGSPIERLIVIADAHRAFNKNFVPSLAVIVRVYDGNGLVIGALAKGKAQGFTGQEIEGEAELGAIVGYHQGRAHLDVNTVGGSALGEEREMDAEAKLRAGYDVASYLRVGIDGQARMRLVGDKRLPGDRTWDWVVGPQVLASYKNFYTAAMAGPATYAYAGSGVGFLATITLGATTL
jgi:hypothetical protein